MSAISAGEVEKTKTCKKLQNMTNMIGRVSDAIQDLQTPKIQETAEHPKVDVVRLNPTALSPQEVRKPYRTLSTGGKKTLQNSPWRR